MALNARGDNHHLLTVPPTGKHTNCIDLNKRLSISKWALESLSKSHLYISIHSRTPAQRNKQNPSKQNKDHCILVFFFFITFCFLLTKQIIKGKLASKMLSSYIFSNLVQLLKSCKYIKFMFKLLDQLFFFLYRVNVNMCSLWSQFLGWSS